MSRWLDMARAAEKPSVPFANIAINAKTPEMDQKTGGKVNIGNNGKWQTGFEEKSWQPVKWDETDFQAFFDERAGVLEFDGELDRTEAELLAFEATIIQWMNLVSPKNLDDDHCAECRKPVDRIGQDAVPVLAGGGGYAWLHHSCIADWRARRRQAAAEALGEIGIDAQNSLK